MTSIFDEKRRLLPRWRFFDQVLQSGECELAQSGMPKKDLNQKANLWDFDKKLKQWEKDSSWENALELVSSAIVNSQESKVISAAEQLRGSKESRNSAKTLAQVALARGRGDYLSRQPPSLHSIDATTRIAEFKRRVKAHPRNAIRYLDLGLAYSSIGQNTQAKRAIDIAAMLAPNNRYVIRCAARFLVHGDDPEAALAILRKSANTKRDPWILATEIAVNSIAGKTSRHVGHARKLVANRSFTPVHTSELNSSIATLELEAGAAKKSRKFFQSSLVCPTENAVAQAQWATAKINNQLVSSKHLELALANEARALKSRQGKHWLKVLENCDRWGNDEIFSHRPFAQASFVASVALGDPILTEEYSRKGLISNPEDHTLHNNLTVALALQNRPDDALAEFEKVDFNDLDDNLKITFSATRGLIDYRAGRMDDARERYLVAIEAAKKNRMYPSVILAGLFLCQEEIVAETAAAAEILAAVDKNVKRHPFPEAEAMLDRLRKLQFKKHQDKSIDDQLAKRLILE